MNTPGSPPARAATGKGARLVRFHTELGNVGDDFSEWLFSRALGPALSEDSDTVLLGIGSILGTPYSIEAARAARRCIVLGSGARSPDKLPEIDNRWEVLCVRGPLTAHALGLPCDRAVADPGILVPLYLPMAPDPDGPVGIVPYFRARKDLWDWVAGRLGWQVISPRQSVEEFVAALTRCSRVYCESMHGAIFADAYGIPWRSISGTSLYNERSTHAFKWTDWTASMGLGFDSVRILGLANEPNAVARVKARLKAAAAVRILSAAEAEGRYMLSSRTLLSNRQDRLQEIIAGLRQRLSE